MYAPREERLTTGAPRALNQEHDGLRAACYEGLPAIAVRAARFAPQSPYSESETLGLIDWTGMRIRGNSRG